MTLGFPGHWLMQQVLFLTIVPFEIRSKFLDLVMMSYLVKNQQLLPEEIHNECHFMEMQDFHTFATSYFGRDKSLIQWWLLPLSTGFQYCGTSLKWCLLF